MTRLHPDLARISEDELVTHSSLSTLQSPSGRTLGLVQLDNGSERVPNTLGPRSLGELRSTLEQAGVRAAAGAFDALVITGSGGAFAAGADLRLMLRADTIELASTYADLGHDALDALGRVGVPTVALIDGVALGGGLELALRATWRLATARSRAIGLPEVHIGLIPGWGGATLLPRIAGLDSAVRVILEHPMQDNRLLDARHARELGVVDEVVEFDGDWATVLPAIDALLSGPKPQPHPVDTLDASISARLTALRQAYGTDKRSLTTGIRLIEQIASATIAQGYQLEAAAISALQTQPQFAATQHTFGYQRLDRKDPLPDAALALVAGALERLAAQRPSPHTANAWAGWLSDDASVAALGQAVAAILPGLREGTGLDDERISRAATRSGWPMHLGPLAEVSADRLRDLLRDPA